MAGHSSGNFAVVRYNPDGSLDTTFGGTGKITTDFWGDDDKGNAMAIQADGRIVVAGYSKNAGNDDFAVVRYNPDGSLDTIFGGTGKVTTDFGGSSDWGNAIAIQTDGRIIVVGYADSDFAIVRYNPTGSLDTTFNGTGKIVATIGSGGDSAHAVAIQSDGKILVAGCGNNGLDDDFAITRYNPNGSLDVTFGSGGVTTTAISSNNDGGKSIVIQSDGKSVVAGFYFDGAFYDFAVVRYNPNGSLDTTFNGTGMVTTAIGSGDDYGYATAFQTDGKIVVAGYSSNSFAVVRYNPDGSLDATFGKGGKVTTSLNGIFDVGYAMAFQQDGKFVVAGYSDNGIDNDFAVVRYMAIGTPPLPPSNLTATAVSSSQIDLSWIDNSNDETGFKIEGPPGVPVSTTPVNVTNYSHTGLACNATYTYSVSSMNAYGFSPPVIATATTAPCTTVVLPSNMNLTIQTGGKGTGTLSYQESGINGNPIGSLINCTDGTQGCTYILPTATWIKLVATPTGDSLFSGFSGNVADCSKGLLFLIQTTNCTAYFDPKPASVVTPPLPSVETPPPVTPPIVISPTITTPTVPSEPTVEVSPSVPVEPTLPGVEQPSTPTTSATEPPPAIIDSTPSVVESPSITSEPTVPVTAPPIMPQALELSDNYGNPGTPEPDMPTNEIFLVLIHTDLGQTGKRLTIDAPERIVVTAKARPYPAHIGERVDIITTYRWTPEGQTDSITIPVRVKKQIRLEETMEITLYRGILYDLHGTFWVDIHYQLKNGTRIGTENAAMLNIHKNHPPSDIHLSNNTVKRNRSPGTVIGTLSSTDEDKGESFLYGLVEDAGRRFTIRDNQLIVNNFRLDKGKKVMNYTVIIRSVDMIGEYLDKSFTIHLVD